MRYVLPTVPNVCSYTNLVKMNCQIFTCSTTDTGFISTKLFFRFQTQFWNFCRNTTEKNVKNTRCSLASYLLLSSSTLQQNHTTHSIKAVVHTVNMKFRKLNKNNVRNTNKTRQLKQELLELSSMCTHSQVQCRDREQSKFCENKISTGCWTRGNLTIHFCQGSVETHIRCGGQYIPHIEGNL